MYSVDRTKIELTANIQWEIRQAIETSGVPSLEGWKKRQ